jgi:hypothetical protein
VEPILYWADLVDRPNPCATVHTTACRSRRLPGGEAIFANVPALEAALRKRWGGDRSRAFPFTFDSCCYVPEAYEQRWGDIGADGRDFGILWEVLGPELWCPLWACSICLRRDVHLEARPGHKHRVIVLCDDCRDNLQGSKGGPPNAQGGLPSLGKRRP